MKREKNVESHYSRFKFVEPKHCFLLAVIFFSSGIMKGVALLWETFISVFVSIEASEKACANES